MRGGDKGAAYPLRQFWGIGIVSPNLPNQENPMTVIHYIEGFVDRGFRRQKELLLDEHFSVFRFGPRRRQSFNVVR